ncbi:MAG: Rho termination protein, partial [Candidatus Goldiibacteriota bacterium]
VKSGFFLVADTELILYGASERDALVKVKGEKINLKDDGSFSMRFHLPDGKMELPIEAVSSDGTEKRHIKITVERKTE